MIAKNSSLVKAKEARQFIRSNTKSAVYARHGIQYNTKTGKILAPVVGWIRPALINGNAKIGKGCFHFSTLPGTADYRATVNGIEIIERGTCCCDCNGCYAKTGNYRFQSTVNALAVRTFLARHFVDFLKRAILAQIDADHVTICRIHAAGDFVSAEYVEMWREVAKACPRTVFWTYTKVSAAEEAFSDLPNANIVKSFIPGYGFNFGKAGYIIGLYNALKAAGKSVYACRCSIDKDLHCTSCHACAKCEYVLFLEHSTGYKPKQDPDYPDFVALVNSQDQAPALAAD